MPNPAQPNPEDFIPFAEQLATLSGEIIRRYFRSKLELEEKEDSSPVTIADKEAEQTMRAYIRAHFPAHGIIGEEFGSINEGAEYCWVLDPIDGTKSFMVGRPIFGTLIALVRDGVPVLGIIDQPIVGERWVGVKGFATNFNYDPVRTRQRNSLKSAILSTTSPYLFSKPDRVRFERVQEAAQYTVYGGDCYSYGLLASGFIDLILETGLKSYDFCALAPIIKGAGGIFTDWDGKEVTLQSDGRIIACGSAQLHAETLSILKVS